MSIYILLYIGVYTCCSIGVYIDICMYIYIYTYICVRVSLHIVICTMLVIDICLLRYTVIGGVTGNSRDLVEFNGFNEI